MTPATELATRAATLRGHAGGSVADWLLDGPVQLRDGPHAGAIAGTVTEAGAAAYVYPEIAGYYLQWLAWRARTYGRTPALARRADGVQRWLARWLADGAAPKTRLHLAPSAPDWRNDAVFCFDVAMVARGLGAAAHAGLLTPDADVTAAVSRELARLIAADGLFAAYRANGAGTALPDRWSTRRGGFLAKAAAGVLTAGRVLPGIDADVVAAARATFSASVAWMVERPHREAHPLLYAFEGVMGLPEAAESRAVLPALAAQFDTLLAQCGPDGQLPETLHAPAGAGGPSRVDVLAQALRIGCLLTAHRPQQPPDRLALARLRQLLERQVRPSGAVAFAVGSTAAGRNVWAAMFADQALAFAAHGRERDPWWRVDPLLV